MNRSSSILTDLLCIDKYYIKQLPQIIIHK